MFVSLYSPLMARLFTLTEAHISFEELGKPLDQIQSCPNFALRKVIERTHADLRPLLEIVNFDYSVIIRLKEPHALRSHLLEKL